MSIEDRLRSQGIESVATPMRVTAIAPDLTTRFRSRAQRRRRKLNSGRLSPSYRWEVVRKGKRWQVVAMQNVAVSRR